MDVILYTRCLDSYMRFDPSEGTPIARVLDSPLTVCYL